MSLKSNKKAIGESYSKLILVGEHAVVYGKPAIAMPFPLKVRATVKESKGPIKFKSSLYRGYILEMPNTMRGIEECIKETLNFLKKPIKNLHITIDSLIPIGRGLGSSAAISIAIVRSLFSFYGQKLSKDILFSLVTVAETYAHGNPSGLDMIASYSEYPIWFKRGKESLTIKISEPFYIVVADTGRTGNTRRAVTNVKKRYDLDKSNIQKSLAKIERIAEDSKYALVNGDNNLLGRLMNLNQQELINLGVSDDNLNKLINVAINAGALGAKLTGGGLGGCIIALGRDLEHAQVVADELVKSGAEKSWYFSTENERLYVSLND